MPRVAELHGKLEDYKAYGAVWQMATQGSAGNIKAFADQLAGLSLNWEDQQAVQGLMREIQAELETRKLVDGFKEKSHTIAVEQDRVLVGGVVIRRKTGDKPSEGSLQKT
jgi:hypothetical protein